MNFLKTKSELAVISLLIARVRDAVPAESQGWRVEHTHHLTKQPKACPHGSGGSIPMNSMRESEPSYS
jgi:hypothetical protein